MRSLSYYLTLVVITLGGLFSSASMANVEGYQEVSTKRGVQQPFWLIETDKAKACLILFAGGDGRLKITASGIKRRSNFLVRSRELFVEQGFNVAVVDVPKDQGSLFGIRTGQDHADDILAVIEFLETKYHKPVWLVGTSRGTISAANVAARLQGRRNPAGIVLTSSVLGGNNDSLHDVELSAVTVPTLFVHNRDDDCHVCPYAGVEDAMQEMSKAKETALQSHTGGRSERYNPCKAMTPHGFLGLEDNVVKGITDWITQRL